MLFSPLHFLTDTTLETSVSLHVPVYTPLAPVPDLNLNPAQTHASTHHYRYFHAPYLSLVFTFCPPRAVTYFPVL